MAKAKAEVRILIVDDKPEWCEVLEERLNDLGFKNILKADNGRECIKIARSQSPDLIFLDIMMPKIDGGDVKKLLSQDQRTRDIPVIFSTGIVTEEEIKDKEAETLDSLYIAKPYNPDKLEEIIRSALGII